MYLFFLLAVNSVIILSVTSHISEKTEITTGGNERVKTLKWEKTINIEAESKMNSVGLQNNNNNTW